MKIKEKIVFLQNFHFKEWLKVRKEVENELSDRQGMFCICRKLATGLHENNCRQFQNKVNSETAKRLKHLII